jgi:tetratricopeptide (TPR) repeat protein
MSKFLYLVAAFALLINVQNVHADIGDDCASSDLKTSIEACTSALALPGLSAGARAVAYWMRAVAYMAHGKKDEAIRDFTSATGLEATNAVEYAARCDAYFQLGKLDEALNDCNHSISMGINDSETYEERASISQLLDRGTGGHCALIISDISKAIELGGVSTPQSYFYRGLCYGNAKEYQKVIDDATKALAMGSKNHFLYYMRAMAYKELGNRPSEEADLRTLLLLDIAPDVRANAQKELADSFNSRLPDLLSKALAGGFGSPDPPPNTPVFKNPLLRKEK